MSTPADTSAIAQGLADPSAASADGQSVTARPMAELVLGIQFQAAAAAAVLPHRGLRRTRVAAPPQVDGHAGPGCGGCGVGPGGFG